VGFIAGGAVRAFKPAPEKISTQVSIATSSNSGSKGIDPSKGVWNFTHSGHLN
jgi:hypothetical protein